MNPRTALVSVAILATIAVVATPAYSAGSGPAGSIRVSLAGPGTLSVGPIALSDPNRNPIVDQSITMDGTHVMLRATPDGDDATFAGWAGACASSGTNETCIVRLAPVGTNECVWAAAVFHRVPREIPATPVDPCAGDGGTGGGSGGGTGGTPGTGGTGGGTGGGAASLPTGTGLAGGATVVRSAPALKGARTTFQAGRVRATGAVPRSATRMVQSLVRVGANGVVVAGRCTINRTAGTYACTARPQKGRWRVITQARRGAAVVAQATTTVTVR